MLFSYQEAKRRHGSAYMIDKAIREGRCFKLESGVYSDTGGEDGRGDCGKKGAVRNRANGVWRAGLQDGSGGLAGHRRQVKCAAGVGGDGDRIGGEQVVCPWSFGIPV